VTLELESSQTFVRVATIVAGASAAEAGVVSGMYIVSVDGVSTEGLDAQTVLARIRGPVGTTVRLGVVGAGAPQLITLSRR
jgi:carboxyl-terminal processing protease